MLAQARQRRVPVLLVTVPNLLLNHSPERGRFFLAYEPPPLYSELATENRVMLESGILLHIINHPGLKADALHPNAAGYRLMAETLYQRLLQEGIL